jgi:hypothetical protein
MARDQNRNKKASHLFRGAAAPIPKDQADYQPRGVQDPERYLAAAFLLANRDYAGPLDPLDVSVLHHYLAQEEPGPPPRRNG